MFKLDKGRQAFEFPAIAQLVERPTVVVLRSHRTVPGSNPGCRMFFISQRHFHS